MKGLTKDNKLNFGRFKGQLIDYVIKAHSWWVKWAVKAKLLELPKYLKI